MLSKRLSITGMKSSWNQNVSCDYSNYSRDYRTFFNALSITNNHLDNFDPMKKFNTTSLLFLTGPSTNLQILNYILELHEISVPKTHFASALSAKRRRRGAVASAKRSGRPTPHRPPPPPAPYSLRLQYRGSPCWRAILHVDDAWAGKTCNRCHPTRPDPPAPLCLSWSGSGRGRRGHADPREGRAIPTVWLEGADVKTRLVPNNTRPFFSPDMFREYWSNELVDAVPILMFLMVK